MTSSDSNPPHSDKKPATTPRVSITKKDFSSARLNACFAPMKNSAYMTTMLARPIFTPGIRPSMGAMADSAKESAIAKANRRPDSAICLVLFCEERMNSNSPYNIVPV